MTELDLLWGRSASGTTAILCFFFFSSRRRHTRFDCDWSSDVCSSDLGPQRAVLLAAPDQRRHGVVVADLRPEAITARPDAHLPRRREVLRLADAADLRSGERRVGEEGRSRGAPYH